MRDATVRILSGAAVVWLTACSSAQEEGPAPAVPLYDNLGNHHHAITTSSEEAQRYFDQGLRLSYAFNHAEAIRSFRHAAELDPECAMCYWGVAYALGPNINAPITEDAAREAWTAIGEARARASNASANERAYIEALASRYVADPAAERAPLDRAYADAMREVAERFPDDPDARTLFAQSLMDTSPWNYWQPDGTPHPFTPEVLESLESVLRAHPTHPGALHLYIHATEASDDPGRAEQYADTLLTLMPGAGHLVHMPAHTYLRVGRYADATSSNEAAARADEAYLAGNKVDGNLMYEMGYVPHNIHFIATSAAMEGRRARSIEASEETRAMAHPDMLRDPAMGGMAQHFALTPLYTMVRFGMWDQVLVEPRPADDLPFMRAIWHMARGMAYASRDQLAEAGRELEALTPLRSEASLTELYVSSVNVASDIVAIAHEVLQAEIAARQRRAADVARHYAAAVEIEDGLTYMEPPDWPIPVRQLQGAALLDVGRAADAAAAFRADMEKFPENGWSLSGLQASLERLNQKQEAAQVGARLQKAWSGADVPVAAGRAQPPAQATTPAAAKPGGC
jgi:tetratricopeptide (TPR) repeat protein